MPSTSELTASPFHVMAVNNLGPNALQDERKNSSFPVRQLTFYLDGSEKMTATRERFMLEFERDPNFKMSDIHELTLPQIRERGAERLKVIAHYLSNESIPKFRARLNVLTMLDPGFMTRLGIHFALFIGAITNSANDEQRAYWLSKGPTSYGISGCFAMTELGHGSNVAGVETTATFDPATDEFIIHTPTLTATKFWIGGAAETATHACVFAQMYVKGKNYGVKSFIVQLRDLKGFDLMPGVAIGDCGAKMGRNAIDNGWIQFTNVRIPRSHLLMKHTRVSREGNVVEPPIAQLTYGALIMGRVSMIKESSDIAKKALTIAIRYGCIRRQFSTAPGLPENKLMDYKIHQQRLIPLLASAFAMHFGAVEVTRIFDKLLAEMDVTKPGDPTMKDVVESLKEIHATSAGLKAYCTWHAIDIIEQCRQCCGGHGYSSYAGLASMFQDYVVQCTWEGDDTVLTLQAGRYLVSCYRDMQAGRSLPSGVQYLNHHAELAQKRCPYPKSGLTLELVSEAFDVVRALMVLSVGEKFESLVKDKNLAEDAAYEECSIERTAAARMHAIGYLYQRFHDAVKKAPPSLQPILHTLCLLFGLAKLQENAGLVLRFHYFESKHMANIQQQMLDIFDQLRPQVVPLVDSFNLSDFIINSPLGCYDGDIYRRFFETVVANNPPKKPAYFERILKPLFSPIPAPLDILELNDDDA